MFRIKIINRPKSKYKIVRRYNKLVIMKLIDNKYKLCTV